ncbi:GNAT family N-acetyltransferase [Metapseudomonas boanensis]|uniref:N-acetyltransferase n=1 Tax=Metapseudomonas boanensis TaxID=2822138 RepID=A0ABS5XH23_9GAMM|nr:N-acetyltransferase [Pseudomonas boanensis]MBT8766993.1 N-acetyltransferase [Pseudomonas boanensis]
MPLVIRTESPADCAAIEHLTAAAFEHAPHTNHTEQFIVNALRRAGQLSISLVAADDDQIVGHVALSPVSISSGATNWFGLGPISVLPARQGEGIGTLLMEAALADLQRRGAAGCVLLGDPAFYQRFGFVARPELVLPGVPAEYFQAVSFSETWPVGDVSYHEAFNATV